MESSTNYDVQSALADLDRGLRSGKIGDQYESVIKVQDLLNRIPFPLFTNAAFLRLTEAFRDGNNSLRQGVLQVVERCEAHLEKIISLEEMCRRILWVSHSNDPVARALTLRLLACMAPVLADKKQIHHLVSNSLDSDDTDELAAAICALRRYTQFSKDFSRGIFDKVASLLGGVETPIKTRLQLVNVFRHMNCDMDTAQRTFKVCHEQLLQSPNDTLVSLILDSLTHLAMASLLIVPDQITLLLSHLNSKRKTIKRAALKDLRLLALHSPHVWILEAVQSLIQFTDAILDSGQDLSMARLSLAILTCLTESKTALLWINELSQSLVQSCTRACASPDQKVVCSAVRLLLNIERLTKGTLNDRIESTLTDTFVCAVPTIDLSDTTQTKSLLNALCTFVRHEPNQAHAVIQSLMVAETNNEQNSLFLEALAAVAYHQPNLYATLTPWAERLLHDGAKPPILLANFLIPPNTVFSTSKSSLDVDRLVLFWPTAWDQYRLGRLAARNGDARLAQKLFSSLATKTVSQLSSGWITALELMCDTERMLSSATGLDVLLLDKAVAKLHQASFNFLAAGPETEMARKFCVCRLKFITCVRDVLVAYNGAKLIPASSAAITANDSQQITARLKQQMLRCCEEFKSSAVAWKELLTHCFDADKCSLELVNLYTALSEMLEQAIRDLINEAPKRTIAVPSDAKSGANCMVVSSLLNWASVELEKLKGETGQLLTIERLDFLLDVISVLVGQSIHFPRFVFQRLQKTEVTLQMSPQPSGSQTAYNLPTGQQLALKIEGIVHVSAVRSPLRSVAEILIKVQVRHNTKVAETLEQRVKPRNEYFAAEFLLDLQKSGTVSAKADLVDSDRRRVWEGSAQSCLRVNII